MAHTMDRSCLPELADLIDASAFQKLLEDFHELAPVPTAIIDVRGRVLVGVGWQEICTRFHRVHPEACRHCVESDTELSAGVAPGEFRRYQCRNRLWDVSTPVMVDGHHVGNVFTGQFFYDDEQPDREQFRAQARRYGFPEEAYLAALDAVPRLAHGFVERAMSFLLKLAALLSQTGWTALQQARSAQAREELVGSLEQSRQRLSRSQAIAHLGSWELDVAADRLTWSDEVYRIFGLEPGAFPATYEGFLAAVHPEDRAAVDGAYTRSLREGRPAYEIEHRVVRASTGEVRWVQERCEHTRDPSGRVLRSVGMVLDITERKEAELALRAAKESLEDADRRKDEFLAVLSHELRNPLAPISNSVYLLGRAEPGSEQARRALQVMNRQVVLLARLVDDLLDATRIRSSKIRLDRRTLELGTLVGAAVEDHRSLFERAGVRLELCAPPAPVHVDGDAQRLAQVVGNLLTNAAKFTGQGGRARVSVAADAQSGRALVTVADDGVGLTPQIRASLFEPFVQADSTLARSKGGLGLGLTLVRGLVALHGGEVAVRSDGPGRGCEFVVSLPLSARVQAATQPAAERAAPAGRRILIVEDSADAAESLRDVLALGGHDVVVAGSGPEGLARARERHPDLVLCDIGLPGMSGYEVARALRSDPSFEATVLVALSGYAQPEDRLRAAQAGFDRHLAKPLDLAELDALAGTPDPA